MAQADCSICEMLGYRACDVCGNVVFKPTDHPLGIDLCAYCLDDRGQAATGRADARGKAL